MAGMLLSIICFQHSSKQSVINNIVSGFHFTLLILLLQPISIVQAAFITISQTKLGCRVESELKSWYF